MKTLAIKLEDGTHAQLTLIARLAGGTLADQLRQAVEAHVANKLSEADIATQAEAALAEIDRETASRRQAIESLLKKPSSTATEKISKAGKKNAQ